MEVEAVYHRNNPIILGCPPQRPPDEIARYRAIIRSGLLKQQLQKAGLSGIKAAWASEVGNTRMLLTIAIEQRYGGHAAQVGHVASQCHVGAYAGKYVIVVDDDIDITNNQAVIQAMATRMQASRDLFIVPSVTHDELDPSQQRGLPVSDKVGIDATAKPSLDIFAAKPKVPKEVMDRINLEDYVS